MRDHLMLDDDDAPVNSAFQLRAFIAGHASAAKARIVVYSKMDRDNVAGLIKFLLAMGDMVESVDYEQLPPTVDGINKVELRPGTVMILCYSASTGQIALTNKVGGVFDEFLPRAAAKLGKSHVAVIVNDIDHNIMVTGVCAVWLRQFQRDQATVKENSSFLQFVSGLKDPMDEYTRDLLESTKYELPTIQSFLRGALGLPEPAAAAPTEAAARVEEDASPQPDKPPNVVEPVGQPDAPEDKPDEEEAHRQEAPQEATPDDEVDAKPNEVAADQNEAKPEQARPEPPQQKGSPKKSRTNCSVS